MVTKASTAGKKVAAKQAAIVSAKTKGAAARKANADAPEVSSADEWRSKSAGRPVEVPSGNVALLRTVGMQAFLKKGIIPNSLRAIALEAITKKKAPKLDMDELSEEQLLDMIEVFDAVTVYCTVAPNVHPVPKDEDDEPIPVRDRDEIDGLWVDEVDDIDKAFIFQLSVGGTKDLESFREEYESRIRDLSGSQDLAENS